MRTIALTLGLFVLSTNASAQITPTQSGQISAVLADAPKTALDIASRNQEVLDKQNRNPTSQLEINDYRKELYCVDKLMKSSSDLSSMATDVTVTALISAISDETASNAREAVREVSAHVAAAESTARRVRSVCGENPDLVMSANQLLNVAVQAKTRLSKLPHALLAAD